MKETSCLQFFDAKKCNKTIHSVFNDKFKAVLFPSLGHRMIRSKKIMTRNETNPSENKL